jgi:hypothetical protein
MGGMAVPHIFGTITGTSPIEVPASYLDDDFTSIPAFNVMGPLFGAAGNGVADDTPAVQLAITAAQAAGGGVVDFPPGTYLITGTLNITGSNITLRGAGQRATQLHFSNGSANSIVVNGVSVTQLYGFVLRDMFVTHGTKTGGIALWMLNAAAIRLVNVAFDQCWNGVLVGDNTNGIEFMYVAINAIQVGGAYGLKWYSVPPAISAQLTLIDVTVQCRFAGQVAFLRDGFTATLRVQGLALLAGTYGYHVINTAASASQIPQFDYIDDMEVDGASISAMRIESMFDAHFSNCDLTNNSGASGQGSADLDALSIVYDAASNTQQMTFTNCYIGNTQRSAARITARSVGFVNCTFTDCSKAGVNSYPSIDLGADGGSSTADNFFVGCKAGAILGASTNASYGIRIASGVQRTVMSAVNFNGCSTGAILNNSGNTTNIWTGCLSITGTRLADSSFSVNTGASNVLALDRLSDNTTYNVLSLNGTLTTAGALGVYGGAAGDGNFYYNAGVGSLHAYRVNGVDIGSISASAFITAGGFQSAAPSGSTAGLWKLGAANVVSPTAPNRTIAIDIGGTVYYLAAKTTNN